MKKIILSLAVAIPFICSCSNGSNSDPWAEADRIVSEMTKVKFPDRTVSIVDFGAVEGDSTKLAHEAINLAITETSIQGGGTVMVPDGVWYTGPITLKSNVNLHLADNATLKFVPDVNLYMPAVLTRWEGLDCYNAHPLIYAYGETNIALTGKGTIDGGANWDNWWGRQKAIERNEFKVNPDNPDSEVRQGSRNRILAMGESNTPVYERIFEEPGCLRPQTVNFCFCRTVLIEDVTLLNSPFWVMHPLFCTDLTVRGVTASNDGPNGDGCDPESCKNVLIEACTFNTGDDCIAIKSGRNNDGRKWNTPSENIVVRDCLMKNGHGGIVVGSEISGGYRNLFVENCKMDSPKLDRVVRIKTSTARGGLIENIFVRNIKVGQCAEAILRINLNYESKEVAQRGFIPEVRNVVLENINCNKSKYGVWLYGLEDQTMISGIVLKNCKFDNVSTGSSYAHGQIGDVNFDNVTINGAPVGEDPFKADSEFHDGFSAR